ncbi:hypothetical protein GX51_06416 [Blastomyces parvus]|uniref:Uncharacterized protein n=1 Tax=Blastomyces parvus TaxID=2060905 RepID=A0A2B7WRN6_9EURO|nr:hypothetical protein GX51_06416 [Blastomyces parvus]
MPPLSDIGYSHDACIAVVRDYYSFLTKMYLDEAEVIEPPDGGWPSLATTAVAEDLGKTATVVSLLRHIPYIRDPFDRSEQAQGGPWCYFADWQALVQLLANGGATSEDLRVSSESPYLFEAVPPHVVGLTHGPRDTPVFLLDTKLGVVYWVECPGAIRYSPTRALVEDDAYDYAPENEAEWRADAAAWAIADFFAVLKDQYRDLHFIPLNSRTVVDVYATLSHGSDGMVEMLQKIYRDHGWPNLERYRKRECMEAIRIALEENYPDY